MTLVTQYDAIHPDLFPADAEYVATYFNGLFAYHGPRLPNWKQQRWIDVFGDAPADCSILDVERFDATPQQVPEWCDRRHAMFSTSLLRIYCDLSSWPEVRSQVARLNTETRKLVRYWVANPTGIPHIVPGSSATQYAFGAGYDTSLCHYESWYGPLST